MENGALTVSIVTRDRPDRVRACVRSLHHIATLLARVLVIDDGSEPPLAEPLGEDLPCAVTVLREPEARGAVVGRNRIARESATEFVLNLDDDAELLDAAGVEQALAVLRADPAVVAVAFGQADVNGELYAPGYQPAAVDRPSWVPCFTGYGYVIRRELFLSLGGYQELVELFGEEKEFGLRALDAGYRIIYLPTAKVAHVHDPRRRVQTMRFRWAAQSSCLQFVLNQPLILVLPGIVGRLILYRKERRVHSLRDPFATWQVLGWVFRRLPAAWRRRKAVQWRTLQLWRKLRRAPEPYPAPAASGSSSV